MIARIPLALSAAIHSFFGPLPCCRFEPSCSQYFSKALKDHGPLKGVVLGVRRILRCRPGAKSRWDPVPEKGVRRG